MSLPIRNPTVDRGGALSQAPDFLVDTANRRALVEGSCASFSRRSNVALCRCELSPVGGGSLCHCCHFTRAESVQTLLASCNEAGRIWLTREEQPTADVRKAEVESLAALQIPIPPLATGRDDWNNTCSSSRQTLVIPLTADRKMLSKT